MIHAIARWSTRDGAIVQSGCAVARVQFVHSPQRTRTVRIDQRALRTDPCPGGEVLNGCVVELAAPGGVSASREGAPVTSMMLHPIHQQRLNRVSWG